MSELTWADPPATKHTTGRSAELDELAYQLKQNPGRWALVLPGHKRGFYTPLKERGAEITARGSGKGLWDVYARWPDE